MQNDKIPVASRQAPLSEGVELKLEERILSGKWAEGFKLPSEGKLCEEFGVSRTAVREALRELRGRGIIETVNGSGSYVASGNLEMVAKAMTAYSSLTSDEKSASDLIEFRVLIEGAALSRLARSTRNKETRLQRLVEVVDAMAAEKDPEKFGVLDSKFHMVILETCNNAFISMIGKALYAHYQRCIGKAHAVATEGMRLDTINEHIVIVDAVKAGNGEAAREALEEHLEAASERGRILGVNI